MKFYTFIFMTVLSLSTYAFNPQDIELKQVYTGLEFDRLVFLTPHPIMTDKFVSVEQGGVISIISENNKTTLLDITSSVSSNGEEGLLGLAFSPDFINRPYFYVYYTAANPLRSRVSRYHAPQGKVDPNSEKVLLEFEQPFSNHNGGQISFGPDGMLYIGTGDGGSGGDPLFKAQDLDSYLGKMLRIDVSGDSYEVPEDNPFAGDFAVKREIYAYGLRNPWRWSFIPGSSKIIVADVGQVKQEEVSILESGDNMGWNYFEGVLRYNDSSLPSSFVHKGPLFTLDRTQSISITGGYVYNGQEIPQLRGKYIFGDFAFGRIWYSDLESNPNEFSLLTQGSIISSFAQDSQGELYQLDYSGKIFKFQLKN